MCGIVAQDRLPPAFAINVHFKHFQLWCVICHNLNGTSIIQRYFGQNLKVILYKHAK